MQPFSLLQENQIRQQQQLLMSLAMKQAFHVLQLPLLELSTWMKEEIELNPVLEIDLAQEEFKESLDEQPEQPLFRNRSQEALERRRKEHQESLLAAPISLYEHLTQQIPFILEDHEDLHLARILIGHLNEKGFLDIPLQEVSPFVPLTKMQRILQTIQTLDPPGVGASNLQECLLLQLKLQNKGQGLAAKIIAEHYQDLLHNRLPQIAQQMGISLLKLTQLIKNEIAPLDLYPGSRFSPRPAATIIPDLIFLDIEGKWHIEVNASFLPRFSIAPVYVETLKGNALENQEYAYLQRHLTKGKWLKRIVQRRHQTLRSIGELILKQQMSFFNAERSTLQPMSMLEAAKELGLNESTIARAVANKYLASPLGIFSLKSFFSQGVCAQNGQKISNRSLRRMLARTIENEDKQRPLSDAKLASHFKKLGIPCARRTIAKYRATLNISPASQRKKWTA